MPDDSPNRAPEQHSGQQAPYPQSSSLRQMDDPYQRAAWLQQERTMYDQAEANTDRYAETMPMRPQGLDTAATELREAAEKLNAVIVVLAKRLHPVLTETDSVECAPYLRAVTPTASPIHTHLSETADALTTAASRISGLIDRLDIVDA